MGLDYSVVKIKDTTEPDKDFRSELNLGLALPFRAKPARSREPETAVVKTVAPDGSFLFLEMTTVSEFGALSAQDFDVTTVLTTMAYQTLGGEGGYDQYLEAFPELKGRMCVFFHLSDICRELELNPANNTSKIKESINRIRSQTIHQKQFSYSTKNRKISSEMLSYEILTDFGYYKKGFSNKDIGDYRSIFYVVFHPKVANQIMVDYMSIMDRKNYLKLKSGIERRIYLQLRSKQRKFGNQYAMDLDEIASTVGFQQKTAYKKREDIKRHLDQIALVTGEVKFIITKQGMKDKYMVYIEHLSDLMITEKTFTDEFYSELAAFYTEEALHEREIMEADIENLRNELKGRYLEKTGKEKVLFQKQELDPIEFAIDLTLYQIIKCNYKPTHGVKALIKHIFHAICEDRVEFPVGYRSFVVKRNNDRRAEAEKAKVMLEIAKKIELEKQEESKITEGFELLWEDFKETKKPVIDAIRRKAKDMLADDDDFKTMLPAFQEKLIETRAKSLARELYVSGEILNAVEVMTKGGFKKLGATEAMVEMRNISMGPEQQSLLS